MWQETGRRNGWVNSTVVGTRGMEDEKHIIQSLFPVLWKESSTLDSAGEYKTALVLKPEREEGIQ